MIYTANINDTIKPEKDTLLIPPVRKNDYKNVFLTMAKCEDSTGSLFCRLKALKSFSWL